MKVSPQERAARRKAFRQMSPAAKLEHIYTYYKWPIILVVIAVIILCSAIHRMATKKDVVLYTAWVNVAVGEDLENQLSEGYLSKAGLDPRKTKFSSTGICMCPMTLPWRIMNSPMPPT